MKERNDIYGFLLIDKICGITSHDVVDMIRDKIGVRKVGHCGTLDPMASGLMIILIGKYTTRQKEFIGLDKVYEGTIEFGCETDSWDIEGRIIKKVKIDDINTKKLSSAIELLTGNVMQIVPPYSAVKYKGKTLYKLARHNKAVPVINKMVNIKWIYWNIYNKTLDFKIKCSSGTYIRSVAHQLGKIIGCGAVLSRLRRIKIGDYDIKDAIDFNEFKDSPLKEVLNLIKR